jgi:hypothetical protein
MLKHEGDQVAEGELIARSNSFFGLFRHDLPSPIAGTLESISDVTGQIILREVPVPVQTLGFVDGTVVEIIPREGAVVETRAAFVQGIFGIGGEVVAPLAMAVETPESILSEERILPAHRGKILAGGALATGQALKRAVEIGVVGVISGGIHDKDLQAFLGYDLGVAITGSEDKGLTVVLTEGFGQIPMAARTFALLQKHEGQKTSMNGATQIRAGVLRPEIIIPQLQAKEMETSPGPSLVQGLQNGSRVRIIREPYFGRLGWVHSLPAELRKIESESVVRVVEVALEDGKVYTLPRANVEVIES